MSATEPATEAASPLARGVAHRLDPRIIPLDRAIGWILTSIVAAGLLFVNVVLLFTGGLAAWGLLLAVPGSGVAVIVVGWLSWIWPPLEFRHASYVLDTHGIEIRRGVVWRRVISVPRSRVQHIDVSQGPLERTYGLGTMSIYTAGTEYAQVGLRGLDHALALQLRDHLLPRESDDAV